MWNQRWFAMAWRYGMALRHGAMAWRYGMSYMAWCLHEDIWVTRGGRQGDAEAGGVGGQGEAVVAPHRDSEVRVLGLTRDQARDGGTALRREEREGRVAVAEDTHVQRARGGGGGVGVGVNVGARAEAIVETPDAEEVVGQGGRAEGALVRGGRLVRGRGRATATARGRGRGRVRVRARVRVRVRVRVR